MNGKDIFLGLRYVDEDIIEEAEYGKFSSAAETFEKNQKQKKRWKLSRTLRIAAVIAVMLLLVGCAAVYVLSLRDMAFGEELQKYYDGSFQNRTLLSLQGVEGTPGYQASKEWYEWLQSYDTDESIYHSEEAFSENFGDDYYAYNLYSREMKEKLDEICSKYDLELLGKLYVDPDVEAGCQALKIQGILHSDAQAEADWGNIRYFANGSFDVEGHMTLTGEDTPWPYTQTVSFSCHRKDAFCNLYGSVGPVGSYEEWTYTTSDGVDVLMVIEKEQISGHSFMIVDRGPYVFIFSTYAFDEGHPMSKEGLEAFSEVFDFTVEPQRVSQDDLTAANERRDAADAEYAADYNKQMHLYSELGYDARIKFQMETSTHPSQLGFAVMDLNGDGVEELLVGENGYIRAAYSKIDNGTQHLMPRGIAFFNTLISSESYLDGIGVGATSGYSYICLCEGNCLAYVYDMMGEDVAYFFAKPVDGALVWTDRILYAPSNAYYAGQPWRRFDEKNNSEPITEERFHEILNSYVRVPTAFTPISQFPLVDNSPSGIGRPDTVYSSYDALIRAKTEWDADHSDWFYCLMDLDGDGQQELFLQEGEWKGVLTVSEGRVKLLECGGELTICEGNIIAFTRSYLDGNQTHCYYKVKNGNAILLDYLRYDKDKDALNPWFRSTDASGQDISMEPISQETYDSIRTGYRPMELDMKPISEYPFS